MTKENNYIYHVAIHGNVQFSSTHIFQEYIFTILLGLIKEVPKSLVKT